MITLELVALLIIFVITTLVLYLKYRFHWWERHGIPYLKPPSLIFGHNYDVFFGRISVAENVRKNYTALSPHRFGGIFNFFHPVLYIRDPDLISNILVKDFNHFSNRSTNFENEKEPLTLHLFNLTGEKWKLLRHKLTPTFTSGKMKTMFHVVKECADHLRVIMDKQTSSGEKVDVKELMARYTTDVISNCAFGLDANSMDNPDSMFRKMGKKILSPTLESRIKQNFVIFLPTLAKKLGIKIFRADVTDFFMKLVRDTFEYRKKNNIQRNDFFNLLICLYDEENLNKSEKMDFNFGLLTAQCLVFFLAGFETSSNALTFALFEMTNHPDVQNKLQKEVDCVLANHDGQITYEALQEMHYMDRVINETERLYPALPVLTRTCIRDYRISDSDYVIRKGQQVFIPVYGLHLDPQYYENPNIFDPEHFSVEANSTRPHHCFLPFGEGPRNCIGMRFALMQVKLALATILSNYNISQAPETVLPVELAPHVFLSTPKDNILLNLSKRCDKN